MENNKSGKVIAIAALVVAVVALSVGFAAFADTLTIENANATVGASSANAFDAGTDQANGLRYIGTPTCVKTSDSSAVTGVQVGSFSTPDTWTGVSVPLGNTTNSVTCTANIKNDSAYIAHITGFSTTTGLSCSSSGANAAANIANVCANTTVTATVTSGGKSDTMTITAGNTASSSSTNTVEVAANGGEGTVTLVINYTEAVTDNDVTITIPTITHDYSSAGHTVTP